jgi:hypothetical protein
VLRLERPSLVLIRHPCFAVAQVIEREVRRVAAIAEGEDLLGAGIDVAERRVDGDAVQVVEGFDHFVTKWPRLDARVRVLATGARVGCDRPVEAIRDFPGRDARARRATSLPRQSQPLEDK